MPPVARRESEEYWRSADVAFAHAQPNTTFAARLAAHPNLACERAQLKAQLNATEQKLAELERRRDEARALAERKAERARAADAIDAADVAAEHANHRARALRESERIAGQRHGFRKAFQVPHGYDAKPLGCGVGAAPFAHVPAAPLYGGAATQVEDRARQNKDFAQRMSERLAHEDALYAAVRDAPATHRRRKPPPEPGTNQVLVTQL